MKYDVNGWKILGRQFENDADIGNLLENILGGKLDAEALAEGKHLLDYQEIAALIDYLDLSVECRVELLTEIISERSKSKGFSGISGFRQLLPDFMQLTADSESLGNCSQDTEIQHLQQQIPRKYSPELHQLLDYIANNDVRAIIELRRALVS